MVKNEIKQLYETGQLSDMDIRFAQFMCEMADEKASDELYLASVLLSHTTSSEKHICLDIGSISGQTVRDIFPEISQKSFESKPDDFSSIKLPTLDVFLNRLKICPVVGEEGEYKPLILDKNNRLYLYRYWKYEKMLAELIERRIGIRNSTLDIDKLKRGLKRYFKNPKTSPDWQKVAAYSATTHNFCVISGGPGTGKTHTVTNILALLLEQNESANISICAPTGKAAARLQESILKAKLQMDCPDYIREKIPEEASTIHRLLGYRHGSPYFWHDENNPLAADVLIVDEASMVSLALMAKLMRALPGSSRIILLGDKDQLSSVEAGAVLGDICDAADIDGFSKAFCEEYNRVCDETIGKEYISDGKKILTDCVVELKHSYRFEKKPVIGKISKWVNTGEFSKTIPFLKKDSTGTVTYFNLPETNQIESRLETIIENSYVKMLKAETLDDAYHIFTTFRILCSHRKSFWGIERMNSLCETILHDKRLIGVERSFYKGRPVMIMRNDYHLNLYNGDVGMVWEDENKDLRVYFPDQNTRFKSFVPNRLPEHETVYAMTIHKSQGSEFDQILMVLPEKGSPIFTRELVYTGITRAKEHIEIWANEDVFKSAVSLRVERRSGLKERLTGIGDR